MSPSPSFRWHALQASPGYMSVRCVLVRSVTFDMPPVQVGGWSQKGSGLASMAPQDPAGMPSFTQLSTVATVSAVRRPDSGMGLTVSFMRATTSTPTFCAGFCGSGFVKSSRVTSGSFAPRLGDAPWQLVHDAAMISATPQGRLLGPEGAAAGPVPFPLPPGS